jgi:tRNA-(ms[2]io[6]A)-hydroxylase
MSEPVKRRLPLLPKTEVAAEGDEDRPPWHWTAIGAVGVFVVWLPLAFVVNGALGRALGGDVTAMSASARAMTAALNVVAFALGCFAGGFVVGRFGGRAGRREATASGLAAGAIAWALAALEGARSGWLIWALLLVAVAAIGAGAARIGGGIGLARRKP